MIPHTDILAIAAQIGADPATLADAMRKRGHDVERPVDGVLERAREICASECATSQAADEYMSAQLDNAMPMKTARAAIEDDLAIVARVREELRPGSSIYLEGWRDCADAITAAMEGRGK